jgi:hypothetical protein
VKIFSLSRKKNFQNPQNHPPEALKMNFEAWKILPLRHGFPRSGGCSAKFVAFVGHPGPNGAIHLRFRLAVPIPLTLWLNVNFGPIIVDFDHFCREYMFLHLF